jgi:RNA polymerase sigma-70 factor (ECF subfamily)
MGVRDVNPYTPWRRVGDRGVAAEGRVEDLETGRFDELIAGVRRSEAEAATSLFRHFQPQLLRYLRAKEPRVADDLAGEVWLRVARRIDEFRGDQREFRIWLFTLARREVIGHRRKGMRRRTDPVELGEFEHRPSSDLTDAVAIDALSSEEAVALIRSHLTDDQAEVVLLRVVAQLDARTVAGVLGRDESWVRVTQHRALERLAKRLGPRSRWFG